MIRPVQKLSEFEHAMSVKAQPFYRAVQNRASRTLLGAKLLTPLRRTLLGAKLLTPLRTNGASPAAAVLKIIWIVGVEP